MRRCRLASFSAEGVKKPFTLMTKIAEHEKKTFRRPKCKRKKATEKIGGFQTIA